MTPQEFRAARESLGLSYDQLSVIIGVHWRTIQRWETTSAANARNRPHPTAARAMHWMLKGFRPPEYELVKRR